jgi:hypothetical protein
MFEPFANYVMENKAHKGLERVGFTSHSSLREPIAHSMAQDEIVEKYMRLSRQSDKLRQRLSLSLPTSSPLSPPEYDPLSSSPPRRMSTASMSSTIFPMSYSSTWSTSSAPVSSIPDHHPTSTEEDTLHEINQQIKATLTELLNCDSVKHDKAFRAWVQARLMDAEIELKRYRKRRSSIDKKTMDAFADHISHTPAFVYRATF